MTAIGVEFWYSCNVLLSTLFSHWLVPNIITSVLPFIQLIISSLSTNQLVSELKFSSTRFWITSIFLSAQKITVSSAYITIPQCKRVPTASLKCRRNKEALIWILVVHHCILDIGLISCLGMILAVFYQKGTLLATNTQLLIYHMKGAH